MVLGYINDNKLIQSRLTNLTSPLIHPNTDKLYLYDDDWNVYPVGFYMNDMRILFYLNITKTLELFTDVFNVTIAFSYSSKPARLTEFDINQINEEYKFVWNLTKENQYTTQNTLLQPHLFRYEYFGPAQFSIFLILYTIIFIVMLIFRNKQPLASRGLTPYFACIIQFLLSFSGITQFVFTLELNRVNCYISRLVRGPLILTIIFLAIFTFFRYILIINLNNRKSLYIQNKKSNQKQSFFNKWIFILLKGLGHWSFHIVIFIAFHIMTSAIFILVSAASEFNCQLTGDTIVSRNAASATDIVFMVILILLFIAGIIIALIDIFSNIISIVRTDPFKLWKDDVYFFRIEVLIIGLLFVFPFFIIVFILKQTIYAENQLYEDWNYFNYSFLNSISYHLLFFMQVLFVLWITIFKWVLSLFEKKRDNIMLDLLENQELYELFQNFVQNEFSEENLVCYVDLQRFKKETDPNNRRALGISMIEHYFNGAESTLEVNVDRAACTIVKTALSDEQNVIPNDLFEGIERTVKTNIYDSFSRFCSTKVFFDYERKQKQIQELLK